MASPSISNALRLRKTLTLFRRIQQSSASTIAASHCLIRPCVRVWRPQPSLLNTGVRVSGAAFSTGRYGGGESEEIGPDTILFEGCDYKHWLITIDFPKDANLTPQDMVRTYEETCAKGLGISIEEAKKKIYACSTTTYQGFQAIMTEEESEKFKGIPGVVFILPDSYIDPVNKEYGGDKYENGVITHRPPPVQYRREGGRFRDRNRNPDQQRFDRQGGPPNQAQNYGPPNQAQNYGPPGSQQNFGSAQNYPPQQNYGSPGSPQAYPPQQGFGQAGQSGAQRTYAPQQSFSMPEAPQGQQNYGSRGASQSYPPQAQQNYGSRGASQSYPPQGQQNYGSRGASQSYPPSHGAPQGYPTQGNYGPPGERGAYQAQQTRGSVPQPHLNYDQYNQGTTQGTHAPAGQGYSGANNRNYSPDNDGHFGQ